MKLVYFYLVVFVLITFCSCSLDENDESEFVINELFKVTLVADDSLLDSPVAFKEDSKGQFWVVEMPGYMRDIDGNDQDVPDGRIVVLKDNDNNGIFDTKYVIIDSLLNPRAIELVYGGILFTDGNALKFAELNNDEVGKITTVDSLYVVGGNIEHQPNGLLYGLDNWIYSAKSNVRYKKDGSGWRREVTSFRGQWGISQDEYGRLIYNHNSAPIIGDVAMPNYYMQNEFLKLDALVGNYYTDDMRLYPLQATSVNRGYQDGVLDSNGILKNFTSACSPIVYYGQNMKDEYGDIFVCAPEANLISKYKVDHVAQTATKEVGVEFLATMDESFRPVALHTGFDGAMYVLDMHKGIIQHSAYMTSYLRELILQKGLDKVNGQGLIFKVETKESSGPNKVQLNDTPSDWLKLLSHSNMNVRLWVQKKLIYRDTMQDRLKKMVLENNNVFEFRHALWTLEGQGAIDDSLLLNINFKKLRIDQFQSVVSVLRKSDKVWDSDHMLFFLRNFINDKIGVSKRLDLTLASLLDTKNIELFVSIANEYPKDRQMVEALVSTVTDETFYLKAIEGNNELILLRQALKEVNSNRLKNNIQQPQLPTKTFDDNRTKGLKLFRTYCASCHGFDGLGLKNTAPSLVDSDIIESRIDELPRIILNGFESEGSKYQIMMPRYIDDPSLDDNDIADLVSYISSTFSVNGGAVRVDEVKQVRRQLMR